MLAVNHGLERREDTGNDPGSRADDNPWRCPTHDPATKSEGNSDVEALGNFLVTLECPQRWEIVNIDIWS